MFTVWTRSLYDPGNSRPVCPALGVTPAFCTEGGGAGWGHVHEDMLSSPALIPPTPSSDGLRPSCAAHLLTPPRPAPSHRMTTRVPSRTRPPPAPTFLSATDSCGSPLLRPSPPPATQWGGAAKAPAARAARLATPPRGGAGRGRVEARLANPTPLGAGGGALKSTRSPTPTERQESASPSPEPIAARAVLATAGFASSSGGRSTDFAPRAAPPRNPPRNRTPRGFPLFGERRERPAHCAGGGHGAWRPRPRREVLAPPAHLAKSKDGGGELVSPTCLPPAPAPAPLPQETDISHLGRRARR